MSLSIDLQPLWDSINEQFPMWLGLLAVPAGISIAIVLANWIIDQVRKAFM